MKKLLGNRRGRFTGRNRTRHGHLHEARIRAELKDMPKEQLIRT